MKRSSLFFYRIFVLFPVIFAATAFGGRTQDLYAGMTEVDITPKLPVALAGQAHLRIAEQADTPLQASILVLESRSGASAPETAVFAACDLVDIPPAYLKEVRQKLKQAIPEIDTSKVILTATHTHNAPVMDTLFANYPIPAGSITQPREFKRLFIEKVSAGIAEAWRRREICAVSWGLSHAVVGYNRRSTYQDGTALMYGGTYFPGFSGIEGYEDHDVNSLFFWNKNDELIGTAVSVACPAQEMENGYTINADYWHEVRLSLKRKFGEKLCVVGWIAAAGDQSPHVMYRYKADQRMHRLSGRSRLEEIGRRISLAIIEAYDIVRQDQYRQVPLIHKHETMALPMRMVTYKEYLDSKEKRDDLIQKIRDDPALEKKLKVEQFFYDRIARRYENQQKGEELILPTEIHVVRLGDIVICTNPFELYSEYGIRIQGRSKALQTFVVQLAGESSYLATERAIKGGGYSAIVQSTPVGAAGGQLLVDRTVDLIGEIMEDK